MELAQKLGARVLALEHRFYGKSQPFGDWSLNSLSYLTVHQATEDLAYFFKTMRAEIAKDYPEWANRRTITIGGSYPGAVSAWMRD